MKKIISLFTIVAFFVFSMSCYSTKNVRFDADTAKEKGKINILQVVTKSGETIEFSKDQPGRIYNDSITGRVVRITGELDKAYIQGTETDKKGEILRTMVSIPLSEVEVMMIADKKSDLGKTLLGIVVTVGIGILIYVVLVLPSQVGN